MMDVDEIVIDQPSSSGKGRNNSNNSNNSNGPFVVVDDAHPFDLDGYIANYTGRTAIDRLTHIIQTCPQLALEAYTLAVQHIHQSREPLLFQTVCNAYDSIASVDGVDLPPASELPGLDSNWTDETIARNQSDRMRLEGELKTYTNSMIKESIRMGHRDLGHYYRKVGDHSTALKHYTKSREFCTTSQHVLEMCMSVIELLIEQKNYSHIPTYVFKADAALDAAHAASLASAAANNNGNGGATLPGIQVVAPTVTAANKKMSAEREKVQTKLDFATALSALGLGNYEKAAIGFGKMGGWKELGDWVGSLTTPTDVTLYHTLTSLATLPRSAIQANLVGSSGEMDPYVRELVEDWMGSRFKGVLGALDKFSTKHMLDPHLAAHLPHLTALITSSAIILYFKPFASIKLERMGRAFGWSEEEVEQRVVGLIGSGEIRGRVDSLGKILQARKTDYRAELFARAIKAGTDMQSANKKLLLRMRLQQADLVIKAPKGHGGGIHELLMDG